MISDLKELRAPSLWKLKCRRISISKLLLKKNISFHTGYISFLFPTLCHMQKTIMSWPWVLKTTQCKHLKQGKGSWVKPDSSNLLTKNHLLWQIKLVAYKASISLILIRMHRGAKSVFLSSQKPQKKRTSAGAFAVGKTIKNDQKRSWRMAFPVLQLVTPLP